jgi:Asp-tRNA(Asn)/Glu-tRNA(Gln) amidotransferase A subunit family amidase
MMLQVLAGYDSSDPNSVDVPVPDFTTGIEQPAKNLRIGVPRTFFFDDLHPEIAAAVEKAIEVFRHLHAEIREVTLEVSNDRTLTSAESYAYHESFVVNSPELYQPATLARIQSGAGISAVDVLRASRELQLSRRTIQTVFDEHKIDVLLTPTVPIPPQTIATLEANPDDLRPQEVIMLRNTRPFNIWGIPAISIPCGFTKDVLPIGLQLASAPWREGVALRAAYAYEQATEWHKQMPGQPRAT